MRPDGGLTLIELIAAMVIIAIALGGTLQLHRVVSLSTADAMTLSQAAAIASAYLEEALLRPFYDPDLGAAGGVCPTREATRPLYDNLCDYNALDDAGARDQTGTLIAGLGNYRVRVAVATNARLGDLVGAPNVLRVDVRVTSGIGVDARLSGYRAMP